MNFPYHNTHSNHALEDKMNISTIFEEEQQLLQIKKRLFQEVNAFRHRNSLPEFYEDHGLSRILQNMLISNPNQVTVESITQHSQPKIASSDIQIINSMRQFSNLSLSKENPMSSLEHLYSEMLNQMMHVTYKEKFVDKKIHNMTLHLGFEYSQAFLIVIFSQTILSVDRIYIEGDHYYITGGVNNPNFSVFILIIKFKDYDIVISPNKMSYDFINHIFKIKFDKRHFSASMNSAPDLCFYVKAGANSVKYGHGTDLTYQDVVKMSSILTFAYLMPLILVESAQLHPKTFLKNSLTRPNLYKNKPSIVFQTDSKQETPVTKNIRNFVNSPIPKFNLNNHLQKDILSPINEESTGHSKKVKVVHNTKELRLPPTFAHIKQLNSMKNIENKENVQRQPMIEEVNRHHTESNKFQLNSINNKMNNKLFNEKTVDPKTLNFFNNFTPQTSFKSTPSENNNRQDLIFSSGNFDKKQLNPFNSENIMNLNTQSQPHFILDGQLLNDYDQSLFNRKSQDTNFFDPLVNNQTNQLTFQTPNSFVFNNTNCMNPQSQQTMPSFNNFPIQPQQNILTNNPFNYSNSFIEQEIPNNLELFRIPSLLSSNSLGNSLTFAPQQNMIPESNHYGLAPMQNPHFPTLQQENKIIDNSGLVPFTNESQVIQTSTRAYFFVPNNIRFRGYNPKEVTIDPNLFKGETLSETAKSNLAILEQKLVGNQSLTRVQQYVQLYQSNELYDVILKFKEQEEIKAHRVVLLQSPYFERVFQTVKTIGNEPIKILMPEFLRAPSFRRVLRYMYYAELESGELETMELVMAREILLTAYKLKLYHLMNIVVVRVIIPKMDKQMCVEFLKDSFEREDEKAKITWKTLQHYCLNFFALHSKSILNKYRSSLEDIDAKLMYKIINKALTKCRDIQHMYELLALLVESGFALNLLDLLERVPLIKEKEKRFDIKFIPNIEELIGSLDPKCCYMTELITCEEVYRFNKESMVCKIIEEKSSMTSEMSTKQKVSNLSSHNHLELNLKYNSKSPEHIPESNEWPEIKKMDPVYEMKLQFQPEFENKTIISQSFDSESRSWRLVIDIEENQKLSVFLLEKGRPVHTPFGSPFKNEFTSTKFLIQVKDGEHEYETLIFHTFANDHFYCVGQRRLLNLSEFINKNILHVKVWMMEFPVYSCAMQYLSTRFNDLLKETFQDNDISKIISFKTEERAYLGTQKNNLNQPVHKEVRTEDKRLHDEFRRRKSINCLEGNFFKEMEPARILNNEDDSDNIDPLAANAISPLANNRPQNTRQNPSVINNLPTLGNQNRTINFNYEEQRTNPNEVDYLRKIAGKPTAKEPKTAPITKSKKFETLSPYDFYYLASSDYLTIEHEKFLAYFMYKFTLEKNEDMVNLISYCLRFSFIELSKLFNMARDLLTVRNNPVFINKLDFEINMRIQSTKPFDRARKFYSTEMYKGWSFKDDLMKWLVESDHHQGYRLKVDELSKIIKAKENQLRNQEEVIIQMSSKIQQMDDAIARHITGEGFKKIKLTSPLQAPVERRPLPQNPGVLSLLKDNCNIF